MWGIRRPSYQYHVSVQATTQSLFALCRHLVVPWWPWCNFSNMSACSDLGITTLFPLNNSPQGRFWWDSIALLVLSIPVDNRPWVYSTLDLHFVVFVWFLVSLQKQVGSSLFSRIHFLVSLSSTLLIGALEGVSAVFNASSSMCAMVNVTLRHYWDMTPGHYCVRH